MEGSSYAPQHDRCRAPAIGFDRLDQRTPIGEVWLGLGFGSSLVSTRSSTAICPRVRRRSTCRHRGHRGDQSPRGPAASCSGGALAVSTGLEDLLGVPETAVTKDRLYRTLDRLLAAQESIEQDLKTRLGTLARLRPLAL